MNELSACMPYIAIDRCRFSPSETRRDVLGKGLRVRLARRAAVEQHQAATAAVAELRIFRCISVHEDRSGVVHPSERLGTRHLASTERRLNVPVGVTEAWLSHAADQYKNLGEIRTRRWLTRRRRRHKGTRPHREWSTRPPRGQSYQSSVSLLVLEPIVTSLLELACQRAMTRAA